MPARGEAAPQVLVDGRRENGIPPEDRGLAYGDGVFETIRFVAGRAPLWDLHIRRLQHGCRRLRMSAPAAATLRRESHRLAAGEHCIIKLILTRKGARGYAPVPAAATRRILMRHEAPSDEAIDYTAGVRLRWCRLLLSSQPLLAGLKHLNRIEQVLARGEWRDPRIHEGLLCDAEDRVVCATSANVFIVCEGVLRTPSLTRCGVAGVARAWTMAHARRWIPVHAGDLTRAEVESATEVFLTNAVRGIVPVRAVGSVRFRVGPVTRRLGYTLAGLGIGRSPIPPLE